MKKPGYVLDSHALVAYLQNETVADQKAHHAISYADAFAVALAQELDATIVTGDPEFKQVEPLVQIGWL